MLRKKLQKRWDFGVTLRWWGPARVPINVMLVLHWHQEYNILLTATHSLRSSPSGSMTARRKFPEPKVAAACFIKSYWWVPSAMFFRGLKVLLDLPPLHAYKHTNSESVTHSFIRFMFTYNKKLILRKSSKKLFDYFSKITFTVI